MDNPKISVLIPLYNRKEYAAECIDSVLNQTFQDFEIIVRDDCSTDGVFEFVKEKYLTQIDSGKVKLFRNKKNIGEGNNINRLIREAAGKYITVLHNDDAYLPNALSHLYETAEKTGADVIHAMRRAEFPTNKQNSIFYVAHEPVIKNIAIMSEKPADRLNQWLNGEIFWDTQYNLFNRKFIIDNEIFNGLSCDDPIYLSLWWTMLAKVFVKTPIVFYIRRGRENIELDDQHDISYFARKFSKFISEEIEMARELDKLFHKVEFIADNEQFQYMIKAHISYIRICNRIFATKAFQNGITPALYKEISTAFKKYFGADYFYPLFLYNWINVIPYQKRADNIHFIIPPPN